MSKKLCFNVNLIYFIVVCLFIAIRICSSLNLFSFLGEYGSYYLGIIIQLGLIFALPIFLLKRLDKGDAKKDTKDFLGYNKISKKMIFVSIAIGIAVFLVNIYVSTFFNSIIGLFGYKSAETATAGTATVGRLFLDLFCTAVLPAICEETLHRGMLLAGNSCFGMTKTIVISGVLFGLLHLNIEQFFYASIIGVFLGYVCFVANSIYPCIIIHFMNNALSVIVSFASARGVNFISNIINFFLTNPVIGFIMMLLVLTLLLIIIYELTLILMKESFKQQFGKKKQEIANAAIREQFFNQIDAIKKDEKVVEPQKRVIYIDASEFIEFMQKQKFEESPDKVLDLKIKILLYGSFILMAIVTLMTFIWGLLR